MIELFVCCLSNHLRNCTRWVNSSRLVISMIIKNSLERSMYSKG